MRHACLRVPAESSPPADRDSVLDRDSACRGARRRGSRMRGGELAAQTRRSADDHWHAPPGSFAWRVVASGHADPRVIARNARAKPCRNTTPPCDSCG